MRLMIIAPVALAVGSLFAAGTAEAQSPAAVRDAQLHIAHGGSGYADVLHDVRHTYRGRHSGYHPRSRGYHGGYHHRHHRHHYRPPAYHLRPPVVVPPPVPVYPRHPHYYHCPHRGGFHRHGRGFGFSITF